MDELIRFHVPERLVARAVRITLVPFWNGYSSQRTNLKRESEAQCHIFVLLMRGAFQVRLEKTTRAGIIQEKLTQNLLIISFVPS